MNLPVICDVGAHRAGVIEGAAGGLIIDHGYIRSGISRFKIQSITVVLAGATSSPCIPCPRQIGRSGNVGGAAGGRRTRGGGRSAVGATSHAISARVATLVHGAKTVARNIY